MRVVVYRDKSDCRRTEAMRAIGYNRIRLLFVCLFFFCRISNVVF